MAIAALSTAGFTQFIAASSNLSASQQALQALQQSLATGNLNAAQIAFNTYQSLNQNLANTSGGAGSSTSASTQLATDLNTLEAALTGGNLPSAQQAFATVQSDLKSSPSAAITRAENAAAQPVQWVEDLLTLSGASSANAATADPTAAILESAFGSNSSYTTGNTTDPTVALLESAYGANSSGSTATSSGGSSGTTANSNAQGSSVNVYG